MIAKHRPDLAGLPRDQVLALRNDPTLSREMTGAYASENAAGLQSAGFDPTPGNTYLAHFAGLGGARSVLGADPATPVASVLPSASVAANPFLRGMTAGDLMNWASRKVGGSAPTMQMPGGAAASGRFGVSGVTASTSSAPEMQMPSPAGEDRPAINAAEVLRSVMSGQPSQPAATSQQGPLAPLHRRGAPFDARAFFALLGKR